MTTPYGTIEAAVSTPVVTVGVIPHHAAFGDCTAITVPSATHFTWIAVAYDSTWNDPPIPVLEPIMVRPSARKKEGVPREAV
jgi:hypothetical protein